MLRAHLDSLAVVLIIRGYLILALVLFVRELIRVEIGNMGSAAMS